MTRIRPISAGELPAFASAAGAEHAADQHTYLARLLEQRATRTEWCYLAEDHGRNLGRVALWTLPTLTRPESVILLDSDDDAIAVELLAHAISVARQAGAETLGSVLDEPAQSPQWQADPERRAGWLVAAGFPMRRATSRWEMAADARSPAIPDRLLFRTLSDVGDAAFLDAIERVSAGSLDLYTQSERGRLGASGEARQTWDDLRDMEWQPGWWELAFDEADALVGLVMPACAPSMGTIGYVGVVPERRGQGYVDDLLSRGTATLLRIDPPVLRADADLDNLPMAAAFARGGWHRIGTRREYELRL